MRAYGIALSVCPSLCKPAQCECEMMGDYALVCELNADAGSNAKINFLEKRVFTNVGL